MARQSRLSTEIDNEPAFEAIEDASNWHSSRYFKISEQMQRAMSARDYPRALEQVRRGIKHLHGFVDESLREFGLKRGQPMPFPIIALLHDGSRLCALLNDKALLEQLRLLVEGHPSLIEWRTVMTQHEELRSFYLDLLRLIETQPGVRQDKLKSLLDAPNSSVTTTATDWLVKAGRVERTKSGKTWELRLAGPKGPKKLKKVASSRSVNTKDVQRVRWQDFPCHPLPPPPNLWSIPETPPCDFSVHVEGAGWRLLDTRPLVIGSDLDPAFRRCHPFAHGVLVLDDLGKTIEGVPAVLVRLAANGQRQSHSPLEHDVYRCEMRHGTGRFAALSRQQVLHVYDAELSRCAETSVKEAPEILKQQKRHKVPAEELHRNLRSISVDDAMTCYLITMVDEAWCIGFNGEVNWGLRFPPEPMEAEEINFQPSAGEDWHQALNLLGLQMPFSPDDARRAFRREALLWHPDVNPAPEATQRMQQLNDAMARVTGRCDDSDLAGLGMTWKITTGRGADWVYACTFAEQSQRSYVATYSGKITEVGADGRPIRSFDAGSPPVALQEIRGRLYVLVRGRLYVLEGEQLVTLVDVERESRLMLVTGGFLVISKHTIIGYNEVGTRQGLVHTRAPILRVLSQTNGIAVETKKERYEVEIKFVGTCLSLRQTAEK